MIINNINYKIVKDDDNTLDEEILKEMITDYFINYDFIVGDWAYGKIRLKGFNYKTNKYYKPLNDFNNIDDYIKNNCAYGCKYFILEKIIDKQD